jgi:hypothetical protein
MKHPVVRNWRLIERDPKALDVAQSSKTAPKFPHSRVGGGKRKKFHPRPIKRHERIATTNQIPHTK